MNGLYQISNLGRVKSLDKTVNCGLRNNNKRLIKGKILKAPNNKEGYPTVVLSKNHKTKTISVHRLVAENFLTVINHIDGNRENNNVDNLEFCDQRHNVKEAFRLGLAKGKKGKENYKSKEVSQYDLNGNFVKKWDCTMDIKRALGYNDSTISKCCTGKYTQAYGYVWRYN